MASRIVLNTISYHGHGAIENIVPELTARGYKKAFVCTDPDLIKFGVAARVTDLLDAAGFAYSVYSDIKPNPTIQNVQDGVAAFQAAGTDCIVAIGGGSAMDTAKAIGIIINQGHRHHRQQPRIRRRAQPGGRCPHQEACCLHHRCAHHRRHRR